MPMCSPHSATPTAVDREAPGYTARMNVGCDEHREARAEQRASG